MQYARLAASIRRHEGERPEAYQDTKGIWTIGVGHNMEHDPKFSFVIDGLRSNRYAHGYRISPQQIADLLQADIDNAIAGARAIFPAFETYTDRQRESLVEMVFQMGQRGVSNFRNMCAAIHAGNWLLAILHGADSKWFREDTRPPIRPVEVLEGFAA